MSKQEEVIMMLERCLSRKDSISYNIFKEEWEAKLKVAKENFESLILWSEEAKCVSNAESKIRKIFLLPLAKVVRDGVRAWDDEYFGTKRNWDK